MSKYIKVINYIYIFFQEILSRGILLPLINQLSDPDYINQYVIWMVRFIMASYFQNIFI